MVSPAAPDHPCPHRDARRQAAFLLRKMMGPHQYDIPALLDILEEKEER